MKNRVAFLVFIAAFSLVQLTMFLAWQRLSSKTLLCSIVSPATAAIFFSSNSTRVGGNDNTKYSDAIMLSSVGVKPRAFPIYPFNFPCVKPEERWWHPDVLRSPAHEGLLFVKEMKTGSSTMAGVTIRIARNVARRNFTDEHWRLCKLRFDHSSASRQDYGKRDKQRSFLFTIIREPTSRAISQFFHFHVSREKIEPNDRQFRKHLLKYPYLQDYYLRDLSMNKYIPGENDMIAAVNNVIQDYDFIGITERLDESLVALQMILNLKTNDLLYIRAKGNGGYDDAATVNRTCQYIVPSFVSPGMENFFTSKRWKRRIQGDELLYKAADISLDMTIDALGRDAFNKQLLLFRKTMALAEATCTNVKFPCTEGGKLNLHTDCLWLDSGCGVHCLDKIPDLG